MAVIGKLILSVGLIISFWGVYKMIKAQTPKEGTQYVPPEEPKYGSGLKLLISGCLLQLIGIWIN